MKRIEFIDRARAIGMFLVYYGHFAQKVISQEGHAIYNDQWRIIYSFHMPLFFFLAGIFWRPGDDFLAVFREKIKTRLIPWIFFSLLTVPAWLIIDPIKFWERVTTWSFLTGNSKINVVTWFLICLMMVELLAALIGKYLKTSSVHLVLYSIGFFFVGYYGFIRNPSSVAELTGIRPDIWYLDDAFMAMPFYFAGYLLHGILIRFDSQPGFFAGILALFLGAYGALQTFQLNKEESFWGVMMIASKYGNAYFFILTAFLGIISVIGLSRVLSFRNPALNFIGQNTIIFLALNGFCQHFIDIAVIESLNLKMNSHWGLFLYASTYSVIILTLFTPLVIGLRRWIPELVGMPWSETSFLPPIGEWPHTRFGKWISAQFKKFVIN